VDLGLTGRTALITGASEGIGRAIAEALAADGHRVIGIDVRDQDAGPMVRTIRADLAEPAAIDAIAADVEGADILVNNAAILIEKPIEETSVGDFDRTIAVNLRAPFLLTRAIGAGMKERGWGRIVNITSVIGLIGNKGQANYSASKAGLIGFTKSVAKELGSRNVLVNAVAPGYIDTELTQVLTEEQRQALFPLIALGRLGEGADVAGAVLFLASDMASYITGQVLVVDGGMVT